MALALNDNHWTFPMTYPLEGSILFKDGLVGFGVPSPVKVQLNGVPKTRQTSGDILNRYS
jgi:hypothetical protein